jgi:O-acetyl-ADP-ribose deacetylase
MTTAGKLACKAVIHVVGPRNGEAKENEKLSVAINNILIFAQQNGFKIISIPAISTGIFGFPKDKFAKILVEESIKFVKDNKPTSESTPEIIEFCIYDEKTLEQFKLVFKL